MLGDDTAVGGIGDDSFAIGEASEASADVIEGGSGTDTLDLSGLTAVGGGDLTSADIHFTDNDRDAGTIEHSGGTITFSGIEAFNFNDDEGPIPAADLDPTNVDDTITLGDGDDTVDALSGDDLVDGGAGNDVLIGGVGSDTVKGGAGDDALAVGDVSDGWWR